MARGRQRKAGLTRMDAAIDALTPLGFSKKLISSTVKALLKVYDDDSGWVFIEEASYKLLIDTILEQQETDAAAVDVAQKGDGREVLNAADSSAAAELQSMDHEMGEVAPDDFEAVPELPYASETVLEVGVLSPNASGTVPAAPGEDPNEEIGSADYSKNSSPTYLKKFGWKDISCAKLEKHKPCYGWISSEFSDDDDDEVDILIRDAVSSPESPLKKFKTGRKRRWDVKPDGL